jgi:thioredoxin reductase (NADPH)
MYNLAIIGAGPAGMSASIYASRYGIKNIIIGQPGGLAATTHEIGNYLGFESITGFEFAQKGEAHVRKYGAEIEYALVKHLKKEENFFKIALDNGKEIEAKNILIAVGTAHRSLGIPGEKEFLGKGLSYCSTCDGYFYRDKVVAVNGGGDSALSAAVFMADIAKKVYLIHRRDDFRAEDFWIEAVKNNPKIELVYGTNIKEIKGDTKVTELILDKEHKNYFSISLEGVFIEIGFVPNVELFRELGIALDESAYIKVDAEQKTNVDGVWAAGDITTNSNKFKQIITAAAEGAIAAVSIQKQAKKS